MSNEFIEELIRAETTINWLDGWQISEVKEATANTFNVASDTGHLNRPNLVKATVIEILLSI